MKSVVALIPARAGSKRVKNKNIRVLDGHPLIAYTIASAIGSGVFDMVIVSTESEEIADVAVRYGAEVPFLRPLEYASDTSADIEWVTYTMEQIARGGRHYEYFSILRPTNPFRQPETIRRAWETFLSSGADALRAVDKCTQHPYKMWVLEGDKIRPFVAEKIDGKCGYNLPYQVLPEVYAQNASLEIARTDVLKRFGEIAGGEIAAFVAEGYEGFDINTQLDWEYAEKLVAEGKAKLPEIQGD